MTYEAPLNNVTFEAVWVGCILVAAIVTMLLNVKFDNSTGQIRTYIAEGQYKFSTTCVLEDGHSFSYSGCPTPIGESGKIMQHDGWFNINYLVPIE